MIRARLRCDLKVLNNTSDLFSVGADTCTSNPPLVIIVRHDIVTQKTKAKLSTP